MSNPPPGPPVMFGGIATTPVGTTHVAGLVVGIGPLLRQLCAWCGHRLVDYDLRRVAVPDGQDPRPATWRLGDLVTVDGHASWVEAHDPQAGLPANACAQVPHLVAHRCSPGRRRQLAVAVQGHVTQVAADDSTPLGSIARTALEQAGHQVDLDRWELRGPDGELLDKAVPLGDSGFADDVRVSLDLRAGVGG